MTRPGLLLLGSWLVLAGCPVSGSVGTKVVPDRDGDGVDELDDCDDLDPNVAPGLDEICDGLDNDCDETIDGPFCTREEIFFQSMKLDLLLVVDNSASMEAYLTRVDSGMEVLLEQLFEARTDTHFGVITMDMESEQAGGRLVKLENKRYTDETMSADDAIAWARDAIQRPGSNGSFRTRAFDTTLAAFTVHAESVNAGFRRADAHLALLYLTDDWEDGVHNEVGPTELVEAIRSLPGSADARFHTIVRESQCVTEVGELPATSYLGLADLTGGAKLGVCEPDYGPFLDAVAQISALEGLRSRFTLRERADPDSLEVAVLLPGGLEVDLDPSGFTLGGDGDQLVLLVPPPPVGSILTVRYSSREPTALADTGEE